MNITIAEEEFMVQKVTITFDRNKTSEDLLKA